MPYNTPIQNTIAVAEAMKDLPKFREILRSYETVDEGIAVTIPDYANLKKPLIEVFTLDSASCAACQYLWAAVCDAKEKYGDQIDTIEYKYTSKEGIAQTRAMQVPNLPTIYINGQPKYVSIIPDADEFYSEIEKLL